MSNSSFNHFNYPPNILILRQLVQPASLLDNILTINKAIRFYFYLKNLYSQSPEYQEDCFSKDNFRDFLFKEFQKEWHDKRDTVPNHSHPNCLCNQSVQEILFPASDSEENWHQLQEEFITLYAPLKGQEELKNYLDTLKNMKPFKVTVKKIYQDLDELTKKGWLTKRKNISDYEKCSELPKDELKDGLIIEIQDELELAYGFDFYQPLQTMLLRFTGSFHNSYIHDTLRHNTFKKIDIEETIRYLSKVKIDSPIKQQLLQKIKNNQDDSYYTLNYRQHDNSVIMRLRSWSPNVEVLLPLDLRQRMREDSQKTWLFYQDLI